MSRESFDRESAEDRQKIFYVTYGQKLTILHPLEVEVREKTHHQWCQNTKYMSHFYDILTPMTMNVFRGICF